MEYLKIKTDVLIIGGGGAHDKRTNDHLASILLSVIF